ncbi:MAG: hypothetical protein B7Z80_05945 [Rhodospirillales bacterium 20-64-7]|nr:MAG: hypothetical protein B7Z80_05945 [Rhodospirillales bacterium 20-64-7]
MSERARGGRAGEAEAPDIAGLGGIAGMIGALRGLVEQLSAAGEPAKIGDPAGTGDSARAEDPSAATFTFGGQNTRVVFGYTLRMGPDGVSAERFGDVPAKSPDARPAALQPITEVYQDGDVVVVIAELPGADPDRVVCRPKGSILLIEATGTRLYRKELQLPAPVKAAGMAQSIRNGILEVRLNRADAP